MKTLLLLRHAKSSKDDPGLKDFDRPLNERGVNDAQLMGKFVRKKKISTDLVLSSPATRAKHTTELFVASSGWKTEPVYDERFYEASVRRLLAIISRIEDSLGTVVLVGHNPGLEELCESLTGEEPKLPTASLACIELDTEKWSETKAGKGHLKWLKTPKQLK